MQGLIPNTYQDLFDMAVEFYHFPKPDAEELLKNIGYRAMSLNAQAPAFYVGDYTQGKYLYLDPSCEKIIGFSKDTLAAEGPSFFNSLIVPEDYEVFNKKIFPVTIEFLKSKDPQERLNYSCSYNYRISTKSGRLLTVLQRATYYLHPLTGHPLASIGFVVDITHFNDATRIIHTIERIDRSFSVLSTEPEYKAVYYPQGKNSLLSTRETEILRLVYEGFSSNEIAEKLFLSHYTVNNHRKKILQKTNCSNVAELINYTIKNNLL